MSGNIIELLRSSHEEIELLEKALTKALHYKYINPKEASVADLMVKHFGEEIEKKSQDILSIYSDPEGLKKEEIEILAGKRNISQPAAILSGDEDKTDVWTNFYGKLRKLRDESMKLNVFNEIKGGGATVDSIFANTYDNMNRYADKIFTHEEGRGRYVDMHTYYNIFINLKKIKKKNFLKIDDYLSYLQNFDKFHEIPLHFKDKNYVEYIEIVAQYLEDFLKKSQALNDYENIYSLIIEGFYKEWENCEIVGWKDLLKGGTDSESLYCIACKKTFTNPNVFQHHKKGKRHIRAINKMTVQITELTEDGEEVRRALDPVLEESYKKIAFKEYLTIKLKELLGEVFRDTMNQIRKKQSRNYNEIEAENEVDELEQLESESSEDDQPVYNPKNVPTGWDGKPIPYWLYKLHGLGIEYKCEICGGASYWGRRAFERHFQEWRHAYGMKCLKIPNTVHFKDVTRIEDALKLHQKIMQDNFINSFKPDIEEEFEDTDGNILNRKQYIDLQRQGLL